jgi:hypothetical protein
LGSSTTPPSIEKKNKKTGGFTMDEEFVALRMSEVPDGMSVASKLFAEGASLLGQDGMKKDDQFAFVHACF